MQVKWLLAQVRQMTSHLCHSRNIRVKGLRLDSQLQRILANQKGPKDERARFPVLRNL